jgi:HEAT repeats
MTMKSMQRGGLAVVVLIVMLGGHAHADRVDDLIDQLGSRDTDVKLRLSAALNLGKIGDRRAVEAFLNALGDPDKTLRGVSAAALGKVVDGSVDANTRQRVVSALDRVARTDRDAFVRSQAQKSYDTLSALATPPTPPPRSGGVYVEVGPMSDGTKKAGAPVVESMRRTAMSALKKKAPQIQTQWGSGGSPTAVDLQRSGTKAFYIDGTLTTLTVQKTGVASVSCNISMVLATYPEKSMFGFMKGSAGVEAGSSSDKAIQQATRDCVDAVVEDIVLTQALPTIQARSR